MSVACLTRIVTLSASHGCFRPDWSAERNERAFGAGLFAEYRGG
jgi:hypothetical protein